nr:immunoglobulin heavy chain junction region [Mus musculus]NSM04680.1 immunoglobulin heavy chain junction region [Mus musculus]NSM04730.1 immunoglobulin heavy chain junction region [Mus musculus]NSM05309.1 immunoglobulin heavy chain junction region [Mus musculus]NSM05937.1 immunoglobulin heavy chain junction region [Mus musculus]
CARGPYYYGSSYEGAMDYW